QLRQQRQPHGAQPGPADAGDVLWVSAQRLRCALRRGRGGTEDDDRQPALPADRSARAHRRPDAVHRLWPQARPSLAVPARRHRRPLAQNLPAAADGRRMSLLNGRIAIVTGGSSGIGRAIAMRFAAEGAVIVLADTSEDPIEGGEPTVELIRRAGGRCSFQSTDVSRWADVDRLVGETVRQHQRLDVMVNNAATYTGATVLDTTEEQWNRVMAVNLTG